MIHSVRFTCVLDTCVIYPIMIRDLLFWFAHHNLYTVKWSKDVFREWVTVMERNGVSPDEILKRIDKANTAFGDACVQNYENLIEGLNLPDEKDRHVLAAAIACNANIIVTNNLKHFPEDYLNNFGLSAKSADEFLADIIDLNPDTAVAAFRELVLNKQNPEMDEYEILHALRKCGLIDTANYLHALL